MTMDTGLPALIKVLLLASLFFSSAAKADELSQTILAQDQALFDAFNNCDLEQWAHYLAEDIEFYQDNDDATTTREQLVPSFLDRCDSENRANLRRELLPDTVEIYPMQAYGAVQMGAHQFWVVNKDKPDELVSTPKFVHLWQNNDGHWQITRVISYAH